MSDPGPLKGSAGLLKAVNAYGASCPGVGEPIIDPAVDLVDECQRRGIEVEPGVADELRDPERWPHITRSALVHLVQAAEARGVKFELVVDHSGPPASVVSLKICLQGG